MNKIEVEGHVVSPLTSRFYEELVELELNNRELDELLTLKPESLRFQLVKDDIPMGYYKILSITPQANHSSSLISMHKQ